MANNPPKFRWNGRKRNAAYLDALGHTPAELAERCSVTVDTIYTWQKAPEYQAQVERYVEMSNVEFTLRKQAGAALQSAMEPILTWLTKMITEGADALTIEERLRTAFRMLDRGGLLDQAAHSQQQEPSAQAPSILIDQRRQILAPGDAELRKELQIFREPPTDIPQLPQNGAHPE